MKKGIHPEYKPVIFHDVGVDFRVLTRSTRSSDETAEWEDGNTYPVIRVDLSSASHSFYTGKQQLISERGGRIEQFRKRYAANLAEEEAKKAAEGSPEEAADGAASGLEVAVAVDEKGDAPAAEGDALVADESDAPAADES